MIFRSSILGELRLPLSTSHCYLFYNTKPKGYLPIRNLRLGRETRKFRFWVIFSEGFSGGSVVKNPPANAGDTSSVPGWGRYPGKGNGNPLQYSCLEKEMATHYNILAWKIPWIEEPGGLQSRGSQKSWT